MRLLAGASALLVLVVAMPPSNATGGVVVTGVGVGDTYLPDGQQFCSGHLVDVEAIYLPGERGMLSVGYEPTASCPLSNGGGYFLGHSTMNPGQVPPVTYDFSCAGSEGTGMYCSGTDNFGQSGWAQVGPYGGPGSIVSIVFSDPDRSLRGSFTAI